MSQLSFRLAKLPLNVSLNVSASQKILSRIGKGLNIEQVNAFFSNSRGLPIKKNGFFMIGFPDETEEDIQKTIDFIATCEFDNIAINIVMAYPGTRLYKQVYGDDTLIIPEFGGVDFNQDLTEETVERIKKYSISPKVSLSEHVDIVRLHALKEIAYNKFYQNKNKNRLLCTVKN